MSILETTNLSKFYGVEPNIVRALDNVNLCVEPCEFVSIVGTSAWKINAFTYAWRT